MILLLSLLSFLGGLFISFIWIRVVLSKLSLNGGKRTNIAKVITELIETEKEFLRRLKIFIDIYNPSIREYNGGVIWKECNEFGFVSLIFQLHSKLLKELEQNKKTRLSVSQALIKYCPWMKLHSSYIMNYDHAIKVIFKERSSSKNFNELLSRVKSDSRVCGLEIDSILITPLQRLPRYTLLLSELLKRTSKNHSSYSKVQEAFNLMKQITEKLNEAKRDLENNSILHDLQENTLGLPENLIAPQRRLIKIGNARIIGGSKMSSTACEFIAQEAIIIVCNDIFVVITQCPKPMVSLLKRNICRLMISRSLIEGVNKVDGGNRGGRFEIHWRDNCWIKFATSNPEERESWINILTNI